MVVLCSRSLLWPLFALGVTACQASAGGQLRADATASGGARAGAAGSVAGSGPGHGQDRVVLQPHLFFNRQTGALESDQLVEFDSNEARLKGTSLAVLESLRDQLRRDPRVQVRIEGHTDSRGSPGYNKELSERRAEAIRQWLIAEGIAPERLTAVGLGEDRASQYESKKQCFNAVPRDPSVCEEEWQRSRQAVYVVTAGSESLTAGGSDVAAGPVSAGGYGMAGCGLGAVFLHDHRRGPQLIVATSHVTPVTQTLAIVSGTSQCQALPRPAATRAFIEANREALARDIARGRGEALDNLATLSGCADRPALGARLRDRFRYLFPDATAPTTEVGERLLGTLREPDLGCALSAPE